MNVLNRDDVQRALDRIVSKTSRNVDATIDEAERFAMENGYTDRDFTHEDGDAEYCFECVKPETYVYDEDGELDYGNGDSEYWLWLIRDKKTGHDIYRKSSPQYEEMFKDTRKASANKAQCVKADEKKEVFVYKAMDVNGNGVFKVFYDDGTYEILKGGRASERKFNDYDKRVSMETLRHATAPPKGKARRASARKVRAKADNVVDVADLAQFIKSAVRTLQTSDATNTRYILDENLAVYVGWSYDDGGSMGYGIPDDSGEYVIYAGVKLRNDSYWADYDWLDYPYDKETGDVWDNGSYIAPDEDYDYLARELSKTYQEILKEVASGHDLGYGVDDYKDESVESSARRRSKKNVNADLKIICDLGDYQPWSGAVETYERIKDAGKLDDFEILMEEAYPEGMTMTELNDILWFEPEWVFEMLGMDNGDEDDEYDIYDAYED